MTSLYRLSIDPSYSLEQAWDQLESIGIEILYSSEEEGQTEIFAHLNSPEPLEDLAWIIACEPYTLPPIDWQEQWAAHGYHFQEGHVHVEVSSFGKPGSTLLLQPGAGFGDLSHPTTRLMLNMIAQYLLPHQIVIDIGCGSGVLSIAAIAMGAQMAYGIDIDPQALEHSRQNAFLNHIEGQCSFSLPSAFHWHLFDQSILILMNMIRTEQQEAWSSLTSLHRQSAKILTSGIRIEERTLYLDQVAQWGWSLQEEKEELGWLIFCFTSAA